MGFANGASAPVGTTPDSRVDDGPVRPSTSWWHRLIDRCRDGVAGLCAVHGARRVALVPIGVVVIVAIGWWALRPGPQRPESTMAFAGEYLPAANGVTAGATLGGNAPNDAVSAMAVAPSVVVHVAGAVPRAGVVILTDGARVVDAVRAVGGVTADADLARVNLAAPVRDGDAVVVPRIGDVVLAVPSGRRDGPVALNSADADELESLPGVGPATAAAIIVERTDGGPFLDVDDLERVPGIGAATVDRLRPYVTV